MSVLYLKTNNGNGHIMIDTNFVIGYEMPNGDSFPIREIDINDISIVNVKIVDASEFIKFSEAMGDLEIKDK